MAPQPLNNGSALNAEAIRAFVAVAEDGQFQLAAARLGISQQATSKRIASLEAALGVFLFERVSSGAVLTADGRTFLPRARAVLDALGEAFACVQRATRPLRVDVLQPRLGSAQLLRAFHRENPAVDVEMVTSTGAPATISALRAGEADAGFTYLREPADGLDPGLRRAYAYLEPVQVMMSDRHPLARASAVRLADLRPYRVWIPGIVAGTEWEAFYAELADASGLDIDATALRGTEAVLDIVAGSPSTVTFVGEKTRTTWPAADGLVRLPVTEPAVLYPWSLVWRASDPHRHAHLLVSYLARTFSVPGPAAAWLPRRTRDDLAVVS